MSGNELNAGGDYTAKCSTCKGSTEGLTKCFICNKYICNSCNNGGEGCSSCHEPLCNDCAHECKCGNKYCERDTDRLTCQMVYNRFEEVQHCLYCNGADWD